MIKEIDETWNVQIKLSGMFTIGIISILKTIEAKIADCIFVATSLS